jgi:hypothetical protein
MGMTLWIHTLEGRDFSKDSDDHSLMNNYLEELDALCDELGVQKLSDFCDYTDANREFGDDFDADEEAEPDPETGYTYGIDDMDWFDSGSGLATMQALYEFLETNEPDAIDEDDKTDLLDELGDCISILEDTVKREGKFHLALVA